MVCVTDCLLGKKEVLILQDSVLFLWNFLSEVKHLPCEHFFIKLIYLFV